MKFVDSWLKNIIMTHTKILFQSFVLLLLCVVKTNAQEVLTLESAVKIALENNYEIKIATNNLTIEKTNLLLEKSIVFLLKKQIFQKK